QDKSRKSLHELQPSAINKETLVGADRMINSTEQSKKAKPKSSKHKNIKTKDKAVQTVQEEKVQIEAEDLISTAGPSKNYWQVIAEKRRVALKNALEENKELVQCIEKLEEEKRIYKEMLDETK
ncbi:hypothetical protein EAG_15741, partial [Camponotus floridanus]